MLSELVEFNPKRPITKGADAPFIEMANLLEGERDVSFIGRKGFSGGGSKFSNGDTLFARITPCLENGKTSKVRGLKEGEIAHGSTEFIIMAAKDLVHDEDFIYYVARLPEFRAFAKSRMEGTSGRQRVSWQALADFELPDIDPAERRQIGKLLASLDDLISIKRETNKTLESLARSIFKDWFVEFGPVKAKAAGVKPPLLTEEIAALFPSSLDDSGLPAGWSEVPLDEVADFLNGLALQKYPGNGDGDLPVIKIAELRSGITTSSGRASKAIPHQYVIEDGDVLFSWSGSLVQKIWSGGRGALNQHLFKVTSQHYPKWLHYFWVDYHLPSFQSIAASKATTMGHIQRHHLSEAKVVIGEKDLMAAADKLFAPIFGQIVSNALEAKHLSLLRDLLIPKLMSGELSSAVASILTGDSA